MYRNHENDGALNPQALVGSKGPWLHRGEERQSELEEMS